jgi:hypothetical protein
VAASVFAVSTTAQAQQNPTMPRGEMIEHHLDSGIVANDGVFASVEFSDVIATNRALWTRLYFADVTLEGDSTIRMTSLRDGEVQELDAAGIEMWGNSSAYFNGDKVLVELVAAPGTEQNRFVLDRVAVDFGIDEMPLGTCGICGGDSRVPSNEPWAGRLMPVGCSASIYNEQSCVVSAGHCMSSNLVMQFNVPNSLPNCDTQNPPVADQFPVTGQLSQNTGVGGDWAALVLGTNNSGETAYQRMGEFRPIAQNVAPTGVTAQVWGYGVSSNCTVSQTQQFSQGQINDVVSTHYRALIDVTFGNSGSALIYNGEIIGIVTHCSACGTGNIMQRIDTPAFVSAREQICPDPIENDFCEDAIVVGDGSTSFSNVGATTTGPSEASDCTFEGDGNIQRDIWYEYTATCTGEITFSLCDGQQPPDGGSCAGFCGGEAPEGCWCDDQCDSFGDCCPDVCDDCPNLIFCQPGECDGHCGGQAPSGCWCDEQCDSFGDCCPDVCNDCPNLSFCGSAAAGAATSGFDTKLAVYGANCPTSSGSVLACNKDACGALSEVTVNATAGDTFKVRIGGHNGASGEGVLTITCEEIDDPDDCPGDLNNDNVVDGADLLILLGDWGPCPGCDGDLNDDNVVDGADLLILLGNWGPCP